MCGLMLRAFDKAHTAIHGSAQCRQKLETSPLRLTGLDRYKINWLWGMMTVTAEKPA